MPETHLNALNSSSACAPWAPPKSPYSSFSSLAVAGPGGQDALVVAPRPLPTESLVLESAHSVTPQQPALGDAVHLTAWRAGDDHAGVVYVHQGRRLVEELSSTVFAARMPLGPLGALVVAKQHCLRGQEALAVAQMAQLPIPWCDRPEVPCHPLRDALFGRLVHSPARAHRVMATSTHLLSLHPMASGDLFDLASTLARMPWASSRPLYQEITGQILDQVGAMHDLDVVHSDIKLENILFWQDGTIALNDFGAAFGVWERDDIASGYLSYTVEYACDAVLAQGDVWPDKNLSPFPHDLFALGATLMMFITHRHLFPCSGHHSSTVRTAYALRQRQAWSHYYAGLVSEAKEVRSQQAPLFESPCSLWAHYLCMTQLLRRKTPDLADTILNLLHPDPHLRGHATGHLEALLYKNVCNPQGRGHLATWLQNMSFAPNTARQAEALRSIPASLRPQSYLRRRSISGAMKQSQSIRPPNETLRAMRRDETCDTADANEELMAGYLAEATSLPW